MTTDPIEPPDVGHDPTTMDNPRRRSQDADAMMRAPAATSIESELDALRRLLTLSENHPRLALAICNRPRLRDELIARLRCEIDIEVVTVPNDITDLFGYVQSIKPRQDARAWFIVDFERTLGISSQRSRQLFAFNNSRDLWEQLYRGPVVFWLPTFVADRLPTMCPDLWRFLMLRAEFLETIDLGSIDDQSIPIDFVDVANLSKDEKLARMAELDMIIRRSETETSDWAMLRRASWLRELARIEETLGRSDDAFAHLQASIRILQRLGPPTVMARAAVDAARMLERRGIIDQALTQYEEARKIFEAESVAVDAMIVSTDIARVMESQGRHEDARRLFEQTRSYFESAGDGRHRSVSLIGLARCDIALGDSRAATKAISEAIEILRGLGDRRSLAVALGDLAQLWMSVGRLDDVREVNRERLQIVEDLGDEFSRVHVLFDIARLEIEVGDVDVAISRLEEAAQLASRINDIIGLAHVKTAIGLAHASAGKVVGAIESLTEAARHFRAVGQISRAQGIENKLARLVRGQPPNG